MNSFRMLLTELGYNLVCTSTDYSDGSPAELGNYIARCMIGYGLQDGSNESSGHVGTAYRPVNLPLHPSDPGKTDLMGSKRWQSLSFQFFIDQSGHLFPSNTRPSFRPEWGSVHLFALDEGERTVRVRESYLYVVYGDPEPLSLIQSDGRATLGD